jgi:hypothetical protein
VSARPPKYSRENLLTRKIAHAKIEARRIAVNFAKRIAVNFAKLPEMLWQYR